MPIRAALPALAAALLFGANPPFAKLLVATSRPCCRRACCILEAA